MDRQLQQITCCVEVVSGVQGSSSGYRVLFVWG
jgi:hypothetical protein